MKEVIVDRGLHNRGYFAKLLGSHGISPSNTGLESPEMLGACERAGKKWKGIAKPIIQAQKLKGLDQMTILTTEANSVVNDCRPLVEGQTF